MKEKDVVKLSDGNKYFVAKKLKIEEKEYACLLRIGNDADFVIVEIAEDGIEIIEDLDEKAKVFVTMGIEETKKKEEE